MASITQHADNMIARTFDFLTHHALGVSFSGLLFVKAAAATLTSVELGFYAETAIKMSAIITMMTLFVTMLLKFIELFEKLWTKGNEIYDYCKPRVVSFFNFIKSKF